MTNQLHKGALAAVLSLGMTHASAEIVEFGTILSPDKEVPPVMFDTDASGQAFFSFDDTTSTFTWSITFEDLSAPAGVNAPGAHIHEGAADENGPIRIDLGAESIVSGIGATDGIFLGTSMLDDALESALFSGNLYVNIHTENAPGGELRGQIVPASVSPVPVPAAVWLFGSAVSALFVRRRRAA